MESGFESIRRDRDESEIIPDRFGFKSASKKHINQNYKIIGRILFIEGERLGNIKRQANSEKKIPDIQGDLSLDQINFYREHYDFPPLTQDEYESIKAQNISDEKSEEVTEVNRYTIDLDGQQESNPAEEEISTTPAPKNIVEGEKNTGTIIFENDDVENFTFNLQRYSGNDEMRFASIRDDLKELDLPDQSIDYILEQKGIPDIPSKSIKIGDKYFDWWDTHSSGYTYKELAIAQYYGINLDNLSLPLHSTTLEPEVAEVQAPGISSENDGETLPEVGELQDTLNTLVDEIATQKSEETEKGGALARVEKVEYTGETDIESNLSALELDILSERAQEAINKYKQFNTNNPKESRTPAIQEQYRNLEKEAWNRVRELAHKLGGNISQELPQLRNILESHRDLNNTTDAKKYLVEKGNILVNDEGNITHIVDDQNNVVELNRPRTFEEIFDKSRPVHILFHIDEEGKTIGYVADGLNENTTTWIETTLSGNTIPQAEIIDKTGQSITESDTSPATNPEAPEQAEGGETTSQVSLGDLRLAYARAEEAWNRKRGDLELENAFESAREAYNTELERVLKLQVAERQEANIHQMFKDEFLALRDRRIEQSQELQGKWEKRLNPIKEKFVNFVIKHKKTISRLNLAAGVAGGALAFTGVGIPLAGGLSVARRMVSATLLGVSTGEGIRSLGEDADINSFWGKIKFQAVIPKLVQESLASSEDEFKQVSEDVLKERLGTLEAYYRLNGGVFTNDNQQQAYEKVLTELARRVQENVIYVENNKDKLQSDWQEQEPEELTEGEILEKANPDRYASELLNTISDTRIVELDKFRRKRKIATGAGIAVGLLAGGAVHLSDEFNKPDSVELTDGSDSTTGDHTPELKSEGAGEGGTGGAGAPEAGADTINPLTQPSTPTPGEGGYPSAPDLPSPEEALRMRQAAAAAEKAQQLAQDVSSLDSGETIWGEIAKQLGTDASQGQIQEAVEKYLGSIKGQDTIFKLAQQTEGGRELLSQWGIDNAGEVAGLSKDQLYEVSKYLGEGKLDGLTELSLDNLNALEQAEYVAPSPTEAPTIEPGSTETPAPPAGTEATGAKPPAPSSPPVTEAPVEAPVNTSQFTKSLSEAIGANNLTDSQIGSVLEAYADTEQGRESLYNMIITSEANNSNISDLLTEYNVIDIYDFAELSDNQLYALAQEVGVENLDKLPGFELNEIILSKFEDAPDMVELTRGTRPLDVVQRYITSEVGNLPYDSNLGKQVLDTYVQTDAGKMWIYDAIVNNPDVNNQNIQYFKEYLRFKDIKSPEEFVSKFNWAEFSGNRNIPTSGFWNQIRLPNGGTRLQPLSSFLNPGPMPGIKDVVRQVLTRQ